MESTLVSILIPFRNTEAYITECLQSVRDQDYVNWEILAVDDHSTDGTAHTVELFAALDHRIRLLKNTEEGIITALRTAYDHARGTLITRMDSDDIMPANKISHLAKMLTRHGPGHLATGLVRYFSIRGISDGYQRYEAWMNALTQVGDNFKDIYKECPIASPCWMVYRTDLDRCGAFGENRYPEDYDLCFRFYREGLKVIPCSDLLHFWRDYDNRTSRISAHYAQNYFLDIKLHYFLELDRNPDRPLVVWGAGQKGKTIAANLKARNLPFHWLCDNPRKIGNKIYGQELRHFEVLPTLENPQSVITVANAQAQTAIRAYLGKSGQSPVKDYFFFC